MKRIGLLLLLCALLFPVTSFAKKQPESTKPIWVTKPVHEDGKTSYLITIKAMGYTEDDAREQATKKIEEERRRNLGIRAKGEGEHDLPGFTYAYRFIDEYWEKDSGVAVGYFLVQICQNYKCDEWEEVVMGKKYPFSGRCFVPGAAQIWKGNKGKGGFFIAATALGAGGIVASFSLKSSYEKLMQEDPKFAMEYSQKADMWQNIGFGCIAFTAAIYLWNVIDGAVAPGKEHIMLRKSSKIKGLSLAPVASPYGDFGLAMQLKF